MPIEFDTNWSAQGLNSKGVWEDAYNLTTYDWNFDNVIDNKYITENTFLKKIFDSSLLKYHHHRGERSSSHFVEAKSTSNESDFVLSVYIIVEIPCVRSGRYQHYYCCTALPFFVTLLRPLCYL